MPVNARGIDVTGLYQDPARMRYGAWRELGFAYGFYEVAIGLRVMPHIDAHRNGMRGAGLLTGPYQALHEAVPAAAQCRLLLDLAEPNDPMPDMLDFEREGLTERMLREWCDEHDARTERELWIYTGKGVWERKVPPAARPRYARYGLLIAAYPFDRPDYKPDGTWQGQLMDPASVARRSTPPAGVLPNLPAPWTAYDAWQHSGHGRLPGYAKDLDLQVYAGTEAELRARYAPDNGAAAILASADAILGEVATLRASLGVH